jgi:hypothetical protein
VLGRVAVEDDTRSDWSSSSWNEDIVVVHQRHGMRTPYCYIVDVIS